MHPVLFQLFGVPMHSYGALLGLSLVLGWHLTLFHCVKAGLSERRMSLCVWCTAIAALAGSRLLYVVTNLERFHSVGEVHHGVSDLPVQRATSIFSKSPHF